MKKLQIAVGIIRNPQGEIFITQRAADARIDSEAIKLTGWQYDCDFIDPFCGSGTFLVEAALMARNIYPGVFRKSFAFEKWPDFDKELFEDIYNDDSQERPFEHHIYAYDIASKTTRRLTSGNSIDTSPSFSPDGRRIVFESDRGWESRCDFPVNLRFD